MPGKGSRDTVKERPKDIKGTLLRLIRYTMEDRWVLLLVIIFCLISNALSLFGPSLAGKAINEAAAGQGRVNFAAVRLYVKQMLLCYSFSALISFLVNVGMMRAARKLGRRMRRDVFDKLMKMPVSYYDRNQAGDIISRVSYDIDVICTSFSTDLVQILASTVTVAGAFIMMLLICPQLIPVTLITIPVSIWFTRRMGRITKPLFSARSVIYGQMNGFVEEMFSGQRTILSYAYEDTVSDAYDEINRRASDAFFRSEYYGMVMGPSIGTISNISLSLIGIFGALLYLGKIITLGQISSYVLYSRKFSGPINEIANLFSEIISALAAAERVFRLLDDAEEPPDDRDAIILTKPEGNVQFDHVSFGYLPGKTVLHDLSLQADAGSLIAIVGPTGAGKTTIINLLMRFYDADSGTIRADGHDIQKITRKSLRRSCAMVLQDSWVFKGTVYENIAYGKENTSREDVIEAAKAAHIHNYILTLPEGYDTVIEEDGGNISKGQKQLLTIARAFLYDAEILILDEATSNVDTTTEKQIQGAMRRLMAAKTCFVIAHRLSTIQSADLILVLDHGDIVEQGTHETLMKNRGLYYRIYNSQFS